MKKIRKKYDLAFKKKAVLLSYKINCVGELEKELNIYQGALTSWRRAYKKNGIESFQEKDHLQLNLEDQKINTYRKKIKKSDLKFEILKNATKYLYQGKSITYDFILKNEKIYSVNLMSEVLCIDRREYYKWKKKPLNDTQKRKIVIQKEITSVFFAFKERYGSERIAIVLQNAGYKIAGRTVRKYMRELGLTRIVKKK